MGSSGTDYVFCVELGDEWSEENYEDLMLCLREDGASVRRMCCAGVWKLTRDFGERSPEVHGQVPCARQGPRKKDAQGIRKRSGVPGSSASRMCPG